MGWTFCYKNHKTIKEFFEKQWTRDDETAKVTVLDAAQVGFSEAYAAIEHINKQTNEREVFAATYMIRYQHNSCYNFGYKDMTEHVGPGMYRCPERIMKLLTPIPDSEEECGNKWANNWRRENWERINKAKEQRKKGPKFKIGDVVVFKEPMQFSNGSKHSQLTVISTKPLRFTDNTMNEFGYSTRYKLSKCSLEYDIDKIIPAEEVQPKIPLPDLSKTGYPTYVDPYGNKHKCIGWGISLRIGWEWYAFKLEDKKNHIYFGFVHGIEDEFGSFSAKELIELGARFEVDPNKLQELQPPVGWKKVA